MQRMMVDRAGQHLRRGVAVQGHRARHMCQFTLHRRVTRDDRLAWFTGQVADFREHSGLAVDLAIEGDEGRCSQAAGLALYRAVQEGLTNVRKHAGATRVAIRRNADSGSP